MMKNSTYTNIPVALIGVGGAGANTVDRIANCSRIIIESQNAKIQFKTLI